MDEERDIGPEEQPPQRHDDYGRNKKYGRDRTGGGGGNRRQFDSSSKKQNRQVVYKIT